MSRSERRASNPHLGARRGRRRSRAGRGHRRASRRGAGARCAGRAGGRERSSRPSGRRGAGELAGRRPPGCSPTRTRTAGTTCSPLPDLAQAGSPNGFTGICRYRAVVGGLVETAGSVTLAATGGSRPSARTARSRSATSNFGVPEPELFARARGCGAAWKPDGTITFVQRRRCPALRPLPGTTGSGTPLLLLGAGAYPRAAREAALRAGMEASENASCTGSTTVRPRHHRASSDVAERTTWRSSRMAGSPASPPVSTGRSSASSRARTGGSWPPTTP